MRTFEPDEFRSQYLCREQCGQVGDSGSNLTRKLLDKRLRYQVTRCDRTMSIRTLFGVSVALTLLLAPSLLCVGERKALRG